MKTIKRIAAGMLLAGIAMQAHSAPSDICSNRGAEYQALTRLRVGGVSFHDALSIVDGLSRDPGTRYFRRTALNDVYNVEPYRHLSPDGAYDEAERACLAIASKFNAR